MKREDICKKLKEANIKNDLGAQAEFAVQLGEYYEKAEMKDYPRASALYHYAKRCNPELEITGIEDRFLESLSLKPKQGWKGDDFGKKLGNLRDTVGTELGKIDVHGLAADAKVDGVKALYTTISGEMKKVIGSMINEAIAQLGGHPYKYAVIGLGSLARQEMTPYSDFEWAILIEDGSDKEYFRRLTKLVHLKVIALGETIIPSMDIPGLEGFYDSITPRGFSFDGLMAKASKYPLGRPGNGENQKGFELIGTPAELLNLAKGKGFEEELHMTEVLVRSTFICGEKKLWEGYTNGVKRECAGSFENIIMMMIEKDLQTYSVDIENGRTFGGILDSKKNFYRFISLFIETLQLASKTGDLSKSNFEILNDLELEDDQKKALKNALSYALLLRLKDYVSKEKQTSANTGHLISQEGKENSFYHITDAPQDFYRTCLTLHDILCRVNIQKVFQPIGTLLQKKSVATLLKEELKGKNLCPQNNPLFEAQICLITGAEENLTKHLSNIETNSAQITGMHNLRKCVSIAANAVVAAKWPDNVNPIDTLMTISNSLVEKRIPQILTVLGSVQSTTQPPKEGETESETAKRQKGCLKSYEAVCGIFFVHKNLGLSEVILSNCSKVEASTEAQPQNLIKENTGYLDQYVQHIMNSITQSILQERALATLRLYTAAKAYSEALDSFNGDVTIGVLPTPQSFFVLGKCYLGQHDFAVTILDQSGERQGLTTQSLILQYYSSTLKFNLDQAYICYTIGIEASNAYPVNRALCHTGMAVVYWQRKEYQNSLIHLQTAEEIEKSVYGGQISKLAWRIKHLEADVYEQLSKGNPSSYQGKLSEITKQRDYLACELNKTGQVSDRDKLFIN
jgi:hypothetical protein